MIVRPKSALQCKRLDKRQIYLCLPNLFLKNLQNILFFVSALCKFAEMYIIFFKELTFWNKKNQIRIDVLDSIAQIIVFFKFKREEMWLSSKTREFHLWLYNFLLKDCCWTINICWSSLTEPLISAGVVTTILSLPNNGAKRAFLTCKKI